jgi:hypothetical protein
VIPAERAEQAERAEETGKVPSEPAAVRPPRPAPETERVRRPMDLLNGLLSLAIILLVLAAIRTLPLGSTEVADDVSHWLTHIPRFLSSAALLVSGLGSFLLAALAVGVLVRDQWRDARNAGVAALVAVGLALGTWNLCRIQGGPIATATRPSSYSTPRSSRSWSSPI